MYLTSEPNPWGEVLEKLKASYHLKKFAAFYGTGRSNTLFQIATLVQILSHVSTILALHSISWLSIWILLFYLRLGLPSDIFPLGFHTKTLYAPLPSPVRATCPANPILCYFITRILCLGSANREAYQLAVSSPPSYVVSQAQNHPQHHILIRPHYTFLPQHERPSFTPSQNKMKNYIYAYFNA